MRARERLRLIKELNGLIGLEPGSDGTTAAVVLKICARLAAAGYKLRSPVDAAEFADRRRAHGRQIQAAADHLGMPADLFYRSRRLARISHTIKRIGTANQRKFFCEKDFPVIRGAPRCRQSVAQNYLSLQR